MSLTRSSPALLLRGSLARSRRIVVSASLATALTATKAVAAEPTPAEPTRVRLLVKASSLGEHEAFYEEKLGAELRGVLEDAGYTLDDDVNADLTVRVRLRLEGYADFEVDFDIAAGPEFVQLETLECADCTNEALLAQIEARYPELLEEAERVLDQAQESQLIEAPPEPDEPAAEEAEVPPPRGKPFGALGIAGIAVAAVGVGALIAGGVEFGRGRVFDDPTQVPGELSYVDHRPVGGALFVAGSVLLVSGVAVLVVDLSRTKKKRQHAGLAQPLLGAGIVGLSYAGRF